MPTINLLRQHFKGDTDLLVLPVDLDNNLPSSTRFMKDNRLQLTVYTAAGVVPKELFKGVLPTTVIIANSKIAMYREGESDYSSKAFIALIDSLRKK